jgi:hypothetical protein
MGSELRLTRLLLGRDSEHASLQPLMSTQAGTATIEVRSLAGRYLHDPAPVGSWNM